MYREKKQNNCKEERNFWYGQIEITGRNFVSLRTKYVCSEDKRIETLLSIFTKPLLINWIEPKNSS